MLHYGARADNSTDLGPAVLRAYDDCVERRHHRSRNILLIPRGQYLLNSNILLGGHGYTFQLDGTVTIAFNTSLQNTMFQWTNCSEVIFTGSGSILGQGSLWRPNNNLGVYPNRPRLVRFQDCNSCKLSGVTLVNSPKFHVTLIGNDNEISHMVVTADVIGTTDGFDISGNNNYVHDVKVTNGDECVTVKTPTNGFRGENIICNFTGGCNMGSFGNGPFYASVENVYYKNVTLYNSNSGARIKTYPNNFGFVRNVTYDTFNMVAVAYPLAIDLYWCPGTTCPIDNGNLTITDVNFLNFHGTQATNSRPAVWLYCLPFENPSCTNINFVNVTVTALNGATHDTFVHACGTGRTGLLACP